MSGAKKDNPVRVLVYVGACTLKGGKPGHEYHEVVDWNGAKLAHAVPELRRGAEGDLRSRVYPVQLGRIRMPGSVLSVEVDPEKPDTIVHSNTVRYLDEWPDKERVVSWAARHEAHERVELARRRLAKQNTRRPAMEALDPIRREYHRLVGTHRTQLLAAVVEYITKGSM